MYGAFAYALTPYAADHAPILANAPEHYPLFAKELITLWQLDTTMMPGGQWFFFCSATDFDHEIYYGGQRYQPIPMDATGFELTTKGALPTPKSLGPGGNIVIVESDVTHFKVAATAIAAATVPAQDGSFIATAAARMPMQNAVLNLGGKWNNTTQRFVTLAGSYTFSLAVMTTSNAANGAVAAYLYKNGTEIARSTATGPSGTPITAALSVTVAAADNDDFEAYCSATPSGMTVLAAGSYFTASGQGRVNSGSIDYFVQGYGGHA